MMEQCTGWNDCEIEYQFDDHAMLYFYSIFEKHRELNDSPLEYNAFFHRILMDMYEKELN
jgi:hypothetical protein